MTTGRAPAYIARQQGCVLASAVLFAAVDSVPKRERIYSRKLALQLTIQPVFVRVRLGGRGCSVVVLLVSWYQGATRSLPGGLSPRTGPAVVVR